jgi:hypothetical protein
VYNEGINFRAASLRTLRPGEVRMHSVLQQRTEPDQQQTCLNNKPD